MKKIFGAVDIGGTKICVGIVQEEKTVFCQETFSTPLGCGAGDKAVEGIVSIIVDQCKKKDLELSDLFGIGVVCAGPVDIKKGTVENPYTLSGWDSYPIVEEIEKRTKCKVCLENDANGALMGEVLLQNIQDKRVLMLTFGTGIGIAFRDTQNIYRCKDGIHPEMGHILVSLDGEQCYCGNSGCFEKQCSGTSMNARSRKLGFKDFDEVYLKKETDFVAQELITTITDEIKNGILSLCVIFQPEIIILGGGFGLKYFPMIEDVIVRSAYDKKDFIGDFNLLAANKDVNPALIGTLMLFL